MFIHHRASSLFFLLASAGLESLASAAGSLDLQQEESSVFVNTLGALDANDDIDVTLKDGSQKTFSKTNASPRGWSGMDGHGSALSIVYGSGGGISGSIVNMEKDEISQWVVGTDDKMFLTVTPSSDFPPEIDPIDDVDHDDSESKLFGERLLTKDSHPVAADKKATSEVSSSAHHQEHRKLGDDEGGNLDVLVVWTKYAECRNAGKARACTTDSSTRAAMESRIELAIRETNDAYTASGVETQLLLVHSYPDYTYTEPSSNAFGTSLSRVRNTSDGYLDGVHAKRTQYGADIVALIIDDSQYCGIAYIGPSIGSMFSVTAWNCATGYYSFGHEIGHNQGCLHDRGTSNACSSSNYQYGWRDPAARFRSILAYNCNSGQCDNNSGGGCTRVKMFSNDEYLYNGSAIGNAGSDNARRINDVKRTIAQYYPHKGSTGPTAAPVTASPFPSTIPTSSPSEWCQDSPAFFFVKANSTRKRTCKWVKNKRPDLCNKWKVKNFCHKTCDSCDLKCTDTTLTFFQKYREEAVSWTCAKLKKLKYEKRMQKCTLPKFYLSCPKICKLSECIPPTAAPTPQPTVCPREAKSPETDSCIKLTGAGLTTFVPISGTPDSEHMDLSCDSHSWEEVDIGFDFPFDGGIINKFLLDANGKIDLDLSDKDNKVCGGQPLGTHGYPRISFAQGDIHPDYFGDVVLCKTPNSLTISFEETELYQESTINSQVQLFDDGRVRICYGSSAYAGSDSCIGYLVAGIEVTASEYYSLPGSPFDNTGVFSSWPEVGSCYEYTPGDTFTKL